MPTKLDFIRSDLLAFKTTLERQGQIEKDKRVTIDFAKRFNSLIQKIKSESSEAAEHLPESLTWSDPWKQAGLADIKYLELEVLVEQILGVVDLLQSGR
jgi:hypothetical protein